MTKLKILHFSFQEGVCPHQVFATQPEMLRGSVRLLIHYLRFKTIPLPLRATA